MIGERALCFHNVGKIGITYTHRVPVEGTSSGCVICMKYRIIVLIIIVITLGKILLLYITNT